MERLIFMKEGKNKDEKENCRRQFLCKHSTLKKNLCLRTSTHSAQQHHSFMFFRPSHFPHHYQGSPLPHPSSQQQTCTLTVPASDQLRTNLSLWLMPPCNTEAVTWMQCRRPPQLACVSHWQLEGRGPARGCSSSGSTCPSGWCCSGVPHSPPVPPKQQRWTAA